MFIKPWPREEQKRPAQGGVIGSHEGVSLHEEDSPRGPRRMILPRAGKSRNVDGSTHRGRGHHPGEVHQVNDEPSWPRNRQTASLRFVHPCTSGRRSSRTLLESQPWPTSRSNDPFRRRLTQSLDRVKPNVKNSSKRRGVETTNASWRRLRRFRGQSCREVSTNRLFSCHNLAIEERLRPMAFVGRERVGDAGS